MKKKKKHDPLQAIEQELNDELNKQINIMYSAAAIAFSRYWGKDGWGPIRITRLFQLSLECWKECGRNNDVSIFKMLEDEVGIEMRRPGSDRSWHELAYSGTEDPYKNGMTVLQWIYMRQQQKKWLGAAVLSCLFLSLHRREGWGPVRIQRLRDQIYEICDEYKADEKRLLNACDDEAGVILRRAMEMEGVG